MTLRKRLFKSIINKMGTFNLDGMVADDGHNALLGNVCFPSNPFFETVLLGHRVWWFPPLELIGVTLKFVLNQSRLYKDFGCCILVPERSRAYRYKYVGHFKRVERYSPGADLFRIHNGSTFVKAAKVKEYWMILALNM